MPRYAPAILAVAISLGGAMPALAQDIVSDAEYYVLKAQHGERWAAEDRELDQRLAALEARYGRKPNIIHETDLFTTFARIGGATKLIPTNRVIDGIDQTSLLLGGDTKGRRDYVFIYAGPRLGAVVKGNYKRHFISPDPVGEASGIPAAFYFLPADPREMSPLLVNMIHLKRPFNRMKLRHDIWKKRYPDSKEKHGVPWRGIANASPELEALGNPKISKKDLPFDPLEYIEELDQLPFDPDMDPGLGNQ